MTDNDTSVLHEHKEKAYQELHELSRQIGAAIRELKERRDKRNELTKHAQEQKQLRKDLSKVIKEKIAEVKVLRAKRGDKPVRVADPRDRGDSPAKIKMEIQRIEHKLETSAMEFTEEQKLTKILKEKKAQLAKMGGENELDHTIRALSKEIDKLKKESDVAHEAVTTSARQSQEEHERILALSKQIEDWKARDAQLQEQYGKLKEQIHAKSDVLPTKKPKKQQPSAEDEQVLKEKAAEVELKVKEGRKLTTEDLLAFQARK